MLGLGDGEGERGLRGLERTYYLDSRCWMRERLYGCMYGRGDVRYGIWDRQGRGAKAMPLVLGCMLVELDWNW